jgi:hypothetical protein
MRSGYQPKPVHEPRSSPPNEGSSAMSPATEQELYRALSGIVEHWYEFGDMMISNQTDYGLEERIASAAKLLERK